MNKPETHTDYIELSRELEQGSDKPSFKLAVLSSFNADFLKPYIMVESYHIGELLRPWFSPFNQFEQVILDDKSALWESKPDIIWISIRIEDIDRRLPDNFWGLSASEARARFTEISDRLLSLVKNTRSRFKGPILVSNFTLADQPNSDIFDAGNPEGLISIMAEQNAYLTKQISGLTDIHIFDYAGCVAQIGGQNWRDQRLWHMARMAVGPTAQKYLSQQISRAAAALLRPPAKCLVLDLDNTLWGGVLGDDGPGAIKIGDDYPGSVFKDFQSALLAYRDRGYLLAIASKNDEKLVCQTLDSHPEMILRTEHFATKQINWNPKPQNIKIIARDLNIGLDSLVFIDDNPIERAYVKAELPMVHVVDMPTDILGYIPALRSIPQLDRTRLLNEDRLRANLYQQEAQRKEFESTAANIADFMQELQMTALIGKLDSQTIERIHQLIHKTNQFNLTTRRHQLETVKQLAESPDSEVAWLRLSDRFGDMGLVCVGIIRKLNTTLWEIDTFLMSCRVMGRNVEDAFMAYLAELAIAKGATKMQGVYVKTPKSTPVEDFYPEHNFTEIARPDETTRIYEKNLTRDTFKWPDHITRLDKDDNSNA